MSNLIPRNEIPAIAEAVKQAANTYGHPDEWPCTLAKPNQKGALIDAGLSEETALKVEALMTSEAMPDEPAAAVAKIMRLVGEFSC